MEVHGDLLNQTNASTLVCVVLVFPKMSPQAGLDVNAKRGWFSAVACNAVTFTSHYGRLNCI